MTRARDLAVPYPSLPTDAPAAEVARILAEEEVDVVFIERQGQLQGVVSDIGLLSRLLPSYIIEDPKLAQMMEEGAGLLGRRRRAARPGLGPAARQIRPGAGQGCRRRLLRPRRPHSAG